MSDARDDGGAAFPHSIAISPMGDVYTSDYSGGGMSLRDYFAAHAPEPAKEAVQIQADLDRARNPHNDYHKPKRRSYAEIICALKYEYADAMLKARKEPSNG